MGIRDLGLERKRERERSKLRYYIIKKHFALALKFMCYFVTYVLCVKLIQKLNKGRNKKEEVKF